MEHIVQEVINTKKKNSSLEAFLKTLMKKLSTQEKQRNLVQ